MVRSPKPAALCAEAGCKTARSKRREGARLNGALYGSAREHELNGANSRPRRKNS